MNLQLLYKTNKNIILILVATIIIYSSIYSFYPARPGINFAVGHFQDQPGWYSWFDQSQYYKMTAAIASGNFSAKDYLYPIGYPILGTPFVLIGHGDSFFSYHQFFLPNLFLLLGVVYVVYNLTLKLTNSIRMSLLSLVFLFFLTLYLQYFIEPWTTHVLDFAFIGIFYMLFRNSGELKNRHLVVAGLLGGWIFATRYVDIIWAAPMFIGFIILNVKKIKYFLPGVCVILLVLFSHYVFLGDAFKLPYWYEVASAKGHDLGLYSKVGLRDWNYDLPTIANRLYCILIEPQHCLPAKTGDLYVDNWWYHALVDKTPILASSSVFFIFSPLGIYLLFRNYNGQKRIIFLTLLMGIAASIFFYSATYSFTSGWTRFWRYEIYWYPIFTIFSIYGISYTYSMIKKKIKGNIQNSKN